MVPIFVMVWPCGCLAKRWGAGERADIVKISKLVMNKWIKLVNLVPLVNNIR